jgi:hypothetical protein
MKTPLDSTPRLCSAKCIDLLPPNSHCLIFIWAAKPTNRHPPWRLQLQHFSRTLENLQQSTWLIPKDKVLYTSYRTASVTTWRWNKEYKTKVGSECMYHYLRNMLSYYTVTVLCSSDKLSYNIVCFIYDTSVNYMVKIVNVIKNFSGNHLLCLHN